MHRVLCSIVVFFGLVTTSQAQDWSILEKMEVPTTKDMVPVVKITGTAPETVRFLIMTDQGLPVAGGRVSPDSVVVFVQGPGPYHVFGWDTAKPGSNKHCLLTVGAEGTVPGSSETTFIPELEAQLTKALSENPDKAKALKDAWTMESLYGIVAEYLVRDAERTVPKINTVSMAVTIMKEQEATVLSESSMPKIKENYPQFVDAANAHFIKIFGEGPAAGDDLTATKRADMIKYFRALAKGARDFRTH